MLAIILQSCISEPQQKPKPTPKKPKVKVIVPAFNSDSAYYFIKKQVSFGPRVISSKGWNNCAIWLEKKLKNYTPNVIVQESDITTYDGKKHTLKNIIASFSPKKNNRIALFASSSVTRFDNLTFADASASRTIACNCLADIGML